MPAAADAAIVGSTRGIGGDHGGLAGNGEGGGGGSWGGGGVPGAGQVFVGCVLTVGLFSPLTRSLGGRAHVAWRTRAAASLCNAVGSRFWFGCAWTVPLP